MPWSDKVKSLLAKFLGTEGSKYITTESGLKLQISDFSLTDKSKATGSWSEPTKNTNSWSDKTKSS